MKQTFYIITLIFLAAEFGNAQSCNLPELKNLGYIVVSPAGPADGGDYGPNTAGTQTSGIQEALDYAWRNSKDVYIVGGGVSDDHSKSVVYYLNTTLNVPWGQQRRLDGGEYWLVYTPTTGDAVFIDGQGNCFLKFGVIVGGKSPNQVVVRLKPTAVGPDEQTNNHAATFVFNGIIGSGGIAPNSPAEATGIGMVIDGTLGTAGVQNSSFYFGEINFCQTGLYLQNKVMGNFFDSPWLHYSGTGIRVADASTASTVSSNIFTGVVGGCSTGVDLFGQKNIFMLNIGGTLPNQGVIFESQASGNLFISGDSSQGFSNYAASPTNRIISAKAAGYGVTTPSIPASGVDMTNTNPFPVEVQIVTPGQVTSWRKTDSQGNSQTFNAGLSIGQRIELDPGCKVRFTYSTAPTWKWMALN